MNGETLVETERLAETHDLTSFDCGVDVLNSWLRQFALSDQKASVSVTYVFCVDNRVVGFFTLAAHAIQPAEAADRLRKGLPVQRVIPVILLARLGLDETRHGLGEGASLMRDCLVRSAAAADDIGARALVVHAKSDEAANFYRSFGFQPLPENPNNLYLLMKDIRASIQEAQI